MVLMWVFLFISISEFFEVQLTLMTLILLFLLMALTCFLLMYLQQTRMARLLAIDPDHIKSVDTFEIYVFHVYRLILESKPQQNLRMHGVVLNHLRQCKNEKCQCVKFAVKLEPKPKSQLLIDKNLS